MSDYAVRRNYPVIGNMRYLFKALRPEMRQYLFESDTDQLPFSHKQRGSWSMPADASAIPRSPSVPC